MILVMFLIALLLVWICLWAIFWGRPGGTMLLNTALPLLLLCAAVGILAALVF